MHFAFQTAIFGKKGFGTLLAAYRTRRAIREKREIQRKEWAKEDTEWALGQREHEKRREERSKVGGAWVREQREQRDALAREQQEVAVQIDEWSKTKMLKIRLAGLLTDNPTLEREFRVGRAPRDAEQMVRVMMELGKQNRIIDAVKYFEALAKALRDSYVRHESQLPSGSLRINSPDERIRRNIHYSGPYRPSDR